MTEGLPDRILNWAEAVCTSAALDAASLVDALGFAGPAIDHAYQVELPTPATGVREAVLVRGRGANEIAYVDLLLKPETSPRVDELSEALGPGRELPAAPGGWATVEFSVSAARARRRCAVLAALEPRLESTASPRVRSVKLYPEPLPDR